MIRASTEAEETSEMISNEVPADDSRLEDIENIIQEFISGNLEARGNISEKCDATDAVITALNELGEDMLARREESKRAEEVLRESEELHRITLSNISDAVFLTDDGGDFIYICPNVEVIFGYSVPEVEEFGNISTLLGPGLHERSKSLDKKEIRNVEIEITDKGGEVHNLLVNVKRVSIKGGTILYVCRDISGRKKVEHELREAEARYCILVESIKEGLGIVDEDENIIYANSAFSSIIGYSTDELAGMNLSKFVSKRGLKKIKTETGKRKEGYSSEYELEIRRKDGEARIIQVFATPWNDRDANFKGTIGLILDITETKETLEALRRSEGKYRTIVENINDALYITDYAGNILDVNENACKMLGYERDELMGANVSMIDTPDPDGSQFKRRIESIIREEAQIFNTEHVRRDGSWIPVNISARVVSSEGNGTIQAFVRDISERRKAEEILRRSEEIYRSVVEDIPALICRFLPDGNLTFVNKAYCEYFRKRREELMGKNFFQFIPEEDREKVIEHYGSLDRETPLMTYEHQVIGKDNEIFWQRWTDLVLSFDDDGAPLEYQSIGVDMTESKRMEEELKHHAENLEEEVQRRTKELIQAKKLASIGQLVTGIAHEVNSPLAVISLYAELLAVDKKDSTSKKYIDIICAHVHSASRIVSGLLDFTRISKMERINLDVNEIILKVMGIIGHQLDLVRIETSLDLVHSVPLVFADPDQLKQVILSIVMNAYHAVEKDGSISITTTNLNDKMVEIKIADNGKGISEKDRKRIFEPFFTTKTSDSTGLGLSISKEIIDSHGGTIGFESEKGKGTSFSVRLPVRSGL